MNRRIVICIMVAVFLLGITGISFASNSDEPIQLAQFSGRAADDAADFDDLDGEYADSETLIADPLKYWNQTWFYLNDGLYHGLFKPLAEGYAWAVPPQPRIWIRNFFTNMLFPVRFINDILTGKFDAAYMETSKFIVNTTFGVLGFGDMTGGMPRNWEPARPTADGFGQTLGKAGMGHGFYLVWPIIGPSSVRESIGWVADAYSDPLTYGKLSFIEFAAIRAFKNVNTLSLQLKGNEYEALTEGAIDKYAAVRDAYIRFRAKKVEE